MDTLEQFFQVIARHWFGTLVCMAFIIVLVVVIRNKMD